MTVVEMDGVGTCACTEWSHGRSCACRLMYEDIAVQVTAIRMEALNNVRA